MRYKLIPNNNSELFDAFDKADSSYDSIMELWEKGNLYILSTHEFTVFDSQNNKTIQPEELVSIIKKIRDKANR